MSAGERSVPVSDLREGMRILGITKLDEKFRMVDSQTLAKLRDTLPGAAYSIERKGERMELTVYDLKPLDAILGIGKIPPDGAFATVGAQTAEELKRMGFYACTVTEPAPAAAAPAAAPTSAAGKAPAAAPGQASPDPQHRTRLTEARQFLELLAVSDEQRTASALAIQDAMESARGGKQGRSAVDQAVAAIVDSGTGPAISAIAGLRASDQTYAHCVDMSVIFSGAYEELIGGGLRNPVAPRERLVAGFMHDIGKSKVPKEILESTARFEPDGEEMRLIRSHAAEGAQILSDMGFDGDVVNVARYHHVKKDTSLGSSYPEAKYADVLPITRLAAVADVYQALIGKRSYKRNWVPGKAVQFLMGLKGTEFDEQALGFFLRSVGIYPAGSLVRLSTGHAAFVIRNEPDKLERPVVVTVDDSDGNRLTHHELIDLMTAADVSISDVLDHYAYFEDSADQPFDVFNSLRVQ